MPGRKTFSGAVAATTTTGFAAGATAIPLAAGAGATYPTGAVGPFVVVVGPETPNEEQILCSGKSGDSLTVATNGRNWHTGGAATGVAHASGEVVRHVLDADSIDEANAHVNDDTRDDHSQYMKADGTRHDLEARHAFGGAYGTPATPASTGDAGATGSGDNPAREDHVHKGVVANEAWTTYVPTVGGGVTVGNGVAAGRWTRHGRLIAFQAQFSIGSTTTVGTGLTLSLPVAAVASVAFVVPGLLFDSNTSDHYFLWGEILGAAVYFGQVSAPTSGDGYISGTNPILLTTGDLLYLSGTYEAAA